MPSGPYLGLATVFTLFVLLIGIKGELGNFLTARTLQGMVHEGCIPGVIALGMLMVIVTGGIDLSVGSVVALVSVVTMQMFRQLYSGPDSVASASLVAVTSGIVAGGLCGLANGLIITRLRLPPLVATLGMYGIARGLGVWLSGRTLIALPRGADLQWVGALASPHPRPGWLLFGAGFWMVLVLAIVIGVLLRLTVLGRHIYAVGSNEATARLCGVSVDRTKVVVYTIAGLLTGLGGVITFAHGSSGNPSAGEMLELDVIAAVVIGGASLSGGRGTVLGTLTGVLILELLRNGVNLFNVPVEMQYIMTGAIIIANMALTNLQRSRH
jgi:ribose transport system permease protein